LSNVKLAIRIRKAFGVLNPCRPPVARGGVWYERARANSDDSAEDIDDVAKDGSGGAAICRGRQFLADTIEPSPAFVTERGTWLLSGSPLAEGEIAIAHISDLHLGSRGDRDAWKLVADCLRKTVKPKLLLVTGDLADKPNGELFNRARDQLDGLDIPYFVCPGNHDRHYKGNRTTAWLIQEA
jgi:hypothetical protein